MITLSLNIFADLVSLRSISIAFHNLRNIADGKLSRFLLKPVPIYMILFYSKVLKIFWKEEGSKCINVQTISLDVSRLRTFSFENNGFDCALKVLLFTALIAFFARI